MSSACQMQEVGSDQRKKTPVGAPLSKSKKCRRRAGTFDSMWPPATDKTLLTRLYRWPRLPAPLHANCTEIAQTPIVASAAKARRIHCRLYRAETYAVTSGGRRIVSSREVWPIEQMTGQRMKKPAAEQRPIENRGGLNQKRPPQGVTIASANTLSPTRAVRWRRRNEKVDEIVRPSLRYPPTAIGAGGDSPHLPDSLKAANLAMKMSACGGRKSTPLQLSMAHRQTLTES